MDLTSPHAFWLLKNGIGEVASPLEGDVRCDVAIIGGGITSALVADALTRRDRSVVVLDRRHAAHGSTCASTALLQFEIDVHLTDLIERVGRERAVAAYRAYLEGVEIVERLSKELDVDVGFRSRSSLYVASRAGDVPKLREEARVRAEVGLPTVFLEQREAGDLVDFPVRAALWSNVAGEVDPWRLCRALFARCAGRAFAQYDRTHVHAIGANADELELHTEHGTVRARHVIVAAGYESESYLPRPVARLHSSFAFVSEPVSSFDGLPERCLLWESARPYLYARSTPDDRLLVGGEDLPFRSPTVRDASIGAKAAKLAKRARIWFPRIEFEIAYAWAGTFGQTDDGLAFVGAHPERDPRILFALGYGGNGITASAIASEILTAAIMGERHRHESTFAFDPERLS